MKKIIGLIVVVATALFLVSCSSVGKKGELIDFSETNAKKSTIRVWIDDEKGEYMAEIIKEFNKIYPDIIVEHQHKGTVEMREHLKTFGPSGNGADVFQFPHDHLSQAVLEDLVLPLPTATADKVRARSHELGIDIGTISYDASTNSFGGANATPQLYTVPMSLEAVGLYYNKELLGDKKVATTYEQIIEEGLVWNNQKAIGKTGTNAVEGQYYLGTSSHWADSYFIQHIYSAFGFTPFGENLDDPSEVGFAKLEKALEWMTGDFRKVTTGSSDHNQIAGGTLFEEGKIPYVIGGPWNAAAFRDAKIDFGVAPLPTIKVDGKDVETKPFAGAMMAAVYKYSKNQTDAIKFVEFLSTDKAMELQYDMRHKLPALKTELLGNISGVNEDEGLMAMSKQLENAVPMPTIPQVTYYWGPSEAMVTQIWNNQADIKESLEEAERSYNTLSGMNK